MPAVLEEGVVPGPLLLREGEVQLGGDIAFLPLVQRGDLPSGGAHDLAVAEKAQRLPVVTDAVRRHQVEGVVKGPRLGDEVPVIGIGVLLMYFL